MKFLIFLMLFFASLHAVEFNEKWTHKQKAEYYNLTTIKEYLKTYKDVNVRDTNKYNGYDMLGFAIYSGDLASVKYLVEHGCSVNHQNKEGHTALFDAILSEQFEIIDYFIQQKADLNLASKEKETSLHFAQATQNLKIISHLIKHGANIEAKDSRGQTPLVLAGKQGNLTVVKFLVMKNASIDFEPDSLSDDFFWVSDDKVAKVIAYLKALKLDRSVVSPTLSFEDTPLTVKQERSSLTLRIKDEGSGIGEVHIFLNGSEIFANPTRALKKKDKTSQSNTDKSIVKRYAIQLQQGLNHIKAYVYDAKNLMQSDDYFLQIVGDYKLDKRPTLHAIVIGVDEFKDKTLNLSYAKADATLFGTTLFKRAKDIFSSVKIHYLRDKDLTTKKAITKALGDLNQISANDFFVFYAASHGIIVDKSFYLLTSDQSNQEHETIKKEALSQVELRELFKRIPTANKLLIFDTCYSGLINKEIAEKLSKSTSKTLNLTSISAAQSKETALEGYADGHGIFTYVLSDALEGEADLNGDGIVKSLEFVQYVKATVPRVAKTYNHDQTPSFFQSGQVFPITKLRTFKGKVALKPQYFESHEIKRMVKSLDKNDTQAFEKIVKKNEKKAQKAVKQVIKKSVERKSTKKITVANMKVTFKNNMLILPVTDKLIKHFSFINAKNEPIIVLDFETSKFTKHSITPVLTPKVVKIKIGWHYDFYRIALQLKKPSTYTLSQDAKSVSIVIKDK